MSKVVSISVPRRGGRGYFYKARLPKGVQSPASTSVRRAVENMDQRLQTGAKCMIVFFKKRGGGYKAVQRCDNRSLSAQAKRRFSRLKGKAVCRSKTTHGKYHKGQFQPCRRGKRRGRR